MAKGHKKGWEVLKTMVDCQQSTIASGTTPSGCTQRAPTVCLISTRPDPISRVRKFESIKTTVDCQQSTVALGTTPSGCTQRAPTNEKFQINSTQWVYNASEDQLTWTFCRNAELMS